MADGAAEAMPTGARAASGCPNVTGTYICCGLLACTPTGLAVGLTPDPARERDACQPGVTAARAADSPHPDPAPRGPAVVPPFASIHGGDSASRTIVRILDDLNVQLV